MPDAAHNPDDDFAWFHELPASVRMDLTCVAFNRAGRKSVPLEELAAFSGTSAAAWRKRSAHSTAVLRARAIQQAKDDPEFAAALETFLLASAAGCLDAAALINRQPS